MRSKSSHKNWWLKCFIYLLLATLAFIGFLGAILTQANTGNDDPAWSNPGAKAIRRASSLPSAQGEPNYFSNLDCTLTDYRLVATSEMKTGCFTPTAFGLFDSDSQVIIFNGTDEGLPLVAHHPGQILAPWPQAANLVSLNPLSTGGAYISLYKNLVGVTSDKRNPLMQLTAKQLKVPPELALKDAKEQLLVINSQTLAFGGGGSWLVAETLHGNFVRVNLASLDVKAFAPSFGSTGSPAALMSRVAVSDSGRYIAIANQAANVFKVYDLERCSGLAENLKYENCPSYDYRPFAGQQIPGLQSIRHLRFMNDGLISFEAISSQSANDGVYLLAPAAGINSLIDYLGLGDSYTSGEGAYNYRSGTDNGDNRCHLSVHSYPVLLTSDLFSVRGGSSVACSGAVIKDIGDKNPNYRGQMRGVASYKDLKQSRSAVLDSIMTNFMPGYVSQQRFVGQYQPANLTISIGGNDIGFGDILEQCVMVRASRHLSDNTCFNTYEDRLEVLQLIDRTVPRWAALYRQLETTSPLSHIYAVGYPSIANEAGNCSINVWLNKSELEFAQELIIYLNNSIQKAASQAGIVYVDVQNALAGHRLCETASHNLAVNGLTAGKDAGAFGVNVLGNESYHPNALGQWLLEQAILKQTRNLSSIVPSIPSNPTTQKLLNRPKSGRPIVNRLPASNLAPKIIPIGSSISLKLDGQENGLRSNTTYAVRLDGPAGQIIGTIVSDNNSDLAGLVTMPTTIPGPRVIDITGENQAGKPVDITQPIYIPVNDTDTDGDGIPNATDSCPTTTNTGQDVDQDGLDDGCDGYIGQPPQNRTEMNDQSQNAPTASNSASSSGQLNLASTTSVSNLRSPNTMMSRVLGASTVSPLSARLARSINDSTAGTSPLPKADLKIINWWHWLGLIVLAWILIIIISFCASRLLKRYRYVPTSSFQLQ